MSLDPPPQFLDVSLLLERSQPRPAPVKLWQLMGIVTLIVLMSAYASRQSTEAAWIVNLLSGLLMIALVGAMSVVSWLMIRRVRREQLQLESIEELVRLRRWPEAAMMLQQMLSEPARTQPARIQALIFLTSVLARYNRFDDAIIVQNYLLEHAPLDGGTSHGLRVARAMAMLREDHLFDADRAINELRQQVSRAGRAMNEMNAPAGAVPKDPEAPQSLSSGLALVEMYRDVKTGHPQEAIELFHQTLQAMREQLGHRVADAYMLAARAYDLLGRVDEARAHFESATLLAPAAELFRRYPETASLAEKYQPAPAPQGVAA